MIKVKKYLKGDKYEHNGRTATNERIHIKILINHIDVFRGTKKVKYNGTYGIFYEDILDGTIHNYGDLRRQKDFGILKFNLFDESNSVLSYNLESLIVESSTKGVLCKELIKPKQKIYHLDVSFQYETINDVEGLYMHLLIDVVQVSRRYHDKVTTEYHDYYYNVLFRDLDGILDINETDYSNEYNLSKNDDVDLSVLSDLDCLFV